MAPLGRALAAVLALALGPALALAQDDTDHSNQKVKVWAAVAFINHGEKTPDLGALDTVLTPVGAQQMLRQGQAFRSRYLGGSSGNSSEAGDAAPIEGIEADSIDNLQLALFSKSNTWTSAGAMAFLQGLYPPVEDRIRTKAGGSDSAKDLVSGDTAEYPLDGYQYPKLQTLSSTDPASIVIQGTVGCPEWENQMLTNLTERADMVELTKESQSFYDKLFASSPLAGTITSNEATFWNAYSLYELVSYLYRHNETVFKDLEDANTTLATLADYAGELERARTSNPVAHLDDPLNTLYTVAGRTLGLQLLDQLSNAILADGERNKLTLLFGSFRPMMSFFSIAGLLTRENLQQGKFSRVPEPGAAMVVELISDDAETAIPEENKLQVRFYYRASADADATFEVFSLFGSGMGGYSIPYKTLKTHMESDGLTPTQWCTVCNATSSASPWCVSDFSGSDPSDSKSGGSSSGSHSGLSNAASGAIGAAVTAAVIGLVFALLFGVLGFRLRRDHQPSAGAGGFKGPEKRASDPDLATSKGGAAQERIGSWEMRGDGHVTRDFSRGRSVRTDEDGISFMGATPVKAHESV